MGVLERVAGEVASLGLAAFALVVPPLCVVCGTRLEASDRWVCQRCRASLEMVPRLRLRSVAMSGRELRIWYALEYTPTLSALIQEMKYGDKPGLGCLLAELAWPALASQVDEDTVLVPVPLHQARRRERGYNQSEIIGRTLGRLSGTAVVVRGLKRVRNTRAQATLDRESRLRNLAGSFRAGRAGSIGRSKVMLVDDVVTTGSTLRECAQVLLDSGLEDVQACAVASRDW